MGIIERFFESIEKAGITSYEIEKKYGKMQCHDMMLRVKG